MDFLSFLQNIYRGDKIFLPLFRYGRVSVFCRSKHILFEAFSFALKLKSGQFQLHKAKCTNVRLPIYTLYIEVERGVSFYRVVGSPDPQFR